ncbi:MAG: hypothetical protein ACTHNK_14735 [Thermomicrobiales bacterium]
MMIMEAAIDPACFGGGDAEMPGQLVILWWAFVLDKELVDERPHLPVSIVQ